MNHFLCTCFAFFCVVLFNYVNSQSSVGDYCTLKRTQTPGVCQLLENCNIAIQDLRTGAYPQNCGFQSNKPIVCCTETSSAPSTPPKPQTPAVKPPTQKITTPTTTKSIKPPTSLTSVQPKNPTTVQVGAKAKKMCTEYGKYVYVTERPRANIPGLKPYVRPDCGIAEVPLIVGGEIAKPKEFPHMALIGFEDQNKEKQWACGGSLISDEFVLTAAHCLSSREYVGSPKYIRLGDLDISRSNEDAKPQEFNIKRLIPHPQFKPPSQYNDIALIQLDKKAILNPYVRPICLNTETKLTTKRAIASGWGQVGYTEDRSSKLRKVTLDYFPNAECNNSYKSSTKAKLPMGILPNSQICAGSSKEAKDTCQGDSGGPLQVYNGKQVFCTYRIVGVTSVGKGCGNFVPGVYTMVSAYIEWIEKIVWP